MAPGDALYFLKLYFRALASTGYARRRGLSGIEFARFGRRLGFRMLLRRARPSISYLMAPVSSTRYFEFPFAYECLPDDPRKCLDVSSPSLFSFYVARAKPSAEIRMINPDRTDCGHTQSVLSRLGPQNLHLEALDLRSALSDGKTYDCIWSLSVVEHIAGEYDDRYAVRAIYEALEPGGRMILTVPVDRLFWDEHRERDAYGTQESQADGHYFFQRYYTEAAIRERLLAPIGREPTRVRWFGETVQGRFAEYERRWMREGYDCVVDDPREFVDFYREYSTWKEMPGKGVCGLMIEKTS